MLLNVDYSKIMGLNLVVFLEIVYTLKNIFGKLGFWWEQGLPWPHARII